MSKKNLLALAFVGAAVTSFAAACGSNESSPSPGTGGGSAMGGTGTGGSATGAAAGVGGAGGATAGVGGAGGAGGSTSGSAGAAGSAVVTGGSAGVAQGGAAGVGAGAGGASGSGTSGGAGASGDGGTGATSGAAGAAGGAPVVRPGVVTTGDGAFWQEGTLTEASGTATVTVNATQMLQQWIGFGGTFNEAGWDAMTELSAGDGDRAIKLLFSASEGANFKWGRIPIGASDYAMDRYTLNETAGDTMMTSFSIERDRMRLIPYVRAAQAVKGDIRFWASPWTPPTWMKDPPEFDATDEGPNGSPAETYEAFMKDDATTLTAYALYLSRWIEEWEKEGIPIDSIHPQNEPGYSTRYPSCRWAEGDLGTFVGTYLAPAFANRNIDTDIWFGTLSNNETAVYNGNIGGLTGAAEDACVGVGLQWNTMGHTMELAARGFLVMQTEHRCGNYPFTVQGAPAFDPNKPQNDYAYAVESWGYISSWIKAGVNSYSAWNMVLDTIGKNLDAQRPWPQNALLVVDRATDQLTVTPVYYVFRHLSYFVDPGAVRVQTTGGDALAFKNPDGSLVAVVHNAGNSASQVVVNMGTKTFGVQVPAKGFATINFKE